MPNFNRLCCHLDAFSEIVSYVSPRGEPDCPGGPDLEVNIIDIAAAAKEFGQEYWTIDRLT
jgi:hypothetical protein